MSNIFNNPQGFDPNDPERLRIEPIGKDKEQPQEIQHLDLPLKSETMLFSSLVSLLMRRLDAISSSTQHHLSHDYIESAVDACKRLLERLKIEDTSRDYIFAQALSDLWHIICKYIEETPRLTKDSPLVTNLELFVKKVYQYPEGSDHTLGYYLSEYAGEKWLPFPFMDLLRALHEDALLKKTECELNLWLNYLSRDIK